MKTFKEFITEGKGNKKIAKDLKVGDVILYGSEDTPHEVLVKPEQDTLGHWVQVKNLDTNRKDRIWFDGGTSAILNI